MRREFLLSAKRPGDFFDFHIHSAPDANGSKLLNNPPPRANEGFGIFEQELLMQYLANEKEDTQFVSLLELQKINTLDGITEYLASQATAPIWAMGDVYICPDDPNFEIDSLKALAPVITAFCKHRNLKRVIAPLSFLYNDRPHAMAFGIEYDRERDHFDAIVLEQHAQRNGTSMDFHAACLHVLNELAKASRDMGSTFTGKMNNKPLSHSMRVCGVVAHEMCRKMLHADSLMELIANQDALYMTEEDVQNSHKRNIIASQKQAAINHYMSQEP